MTEERQEREKANAKAMVSAQLRTWMLRERIDRFRLSELSGVHSDSIYKILRGDRGASVDTLAVLAAALRIPISTLLTPLQVDNGSDE